MAGLELHELSADTALQANSLELRPGQEQFETPVTYANADGSLDPTKAWSRVITLDGQVVGFVRAYFDSSHPDESLQSCVWRVSVDASAQGTGVGRFAIDAVKEEAKARGFTLLTALWSGGDSGPGEFFRHLGFQETGVSEYGDTIGSLSL
ncbi:MAG: GNAT family N-acetyltransferase [Pontimonas sp.]|jgi:diamine N-acetyltransferase